MGTSFFISLLRFTYIELQVYRLFPKSGRRFYLGGMTLIHSFYIRAIFIRTNKFKNILKTFEVEILKNFLNIKRKFSLSSQIDVLTKKSMSGINNNAFSVAKFHYFFSSVELLQDALHPPLKHKNTHFPPEIPSFDTLFYSKLSLK